MKKTVNINLGGTLFHIDEDAYNRLTRYLDSIRASIGDPQGREEVMKDIEIRIAELFSQKMRHDKQVITLGEVEEVIDVMGQPEDYAVDDDLFEDGSATSQTGKNPKKLFRDIDDKYLGGVSSGLAHYIGIEAVWMRLLWVLLFFLTSGTGVIFYLLLWMLLPAAESVADKLTMKGEPVNVSNIEKKVKEAYENVADKVKNADYDRYGKRIKSNTDSLVDGVGRFLKALLLIFVKLIGGLVVLVAGLTLIGLVIGLFFTGVSGFWGDWYGDLWLVESAYAPAWLLSALGILVVGIPFFALFILGMKILIPNLRPLSRIGKMSLLGVWILALFALIFLSIQESRRTWHSGSAVHTEELDIYPRDTLYVDMRTNRHFEREATRRSGSQMKYTEADEAVRYFTNIRLIVKSTRDSVAALAVDKKAKGTHYQEARALAKKIEYGYALQGNRLSLDGYFLIDADEKQREQAVELTLYLPEGSMLYAEPNTASYHRNPSRYGDILNTGDEGYYLEIQNRKTRCTNCPEPPTEVPESPDSKKTPETWNDDEAWDRAWEQSA